MCERTRVARQWLLVAHSGYSRVLNSTLSSFERKRTGTTMLDRWFLLAVTSELPRSCLSPTLSKVLVRCFAVYNLSLPWPCILGTAMDERVEALLADVLALEGEDPNVIREGARGALADYEQLFRAQEVNKRMKDKAAHACQCAVPRSPGRRDAIAQGNVDRRALKGSPQHYQWTAFPLKE